MLQSKKIIFKRDIVRTGFAPARDKPGLVVVSREKESLDKIAVLIPCYNEEKTVEKVVRDFREVLPEAVIYVYDNNSLSVAMSICREREMLSAECSARLMRRCIL